MSLASCHWLQDPNAIAGKVTVTGKPVKVWDSYRDMYRYVHPVLVFAYADTPARRSWLLGCGHTGRSGCDKCGIRGVRELTSGVPLGNTCFLGYSGSTLALVYDADKNVRFTGDLVVTVYARAIIRFFTSAALLHACNHHRHAGMGSLQCVSRSTPKW